MPQIVRLRSVGRVRARAARQGVVAVLEDGLGHLPPPLDRTVQALVPGDRGQDSVVHHECVAPDLIVEAGVVI